ncbi:MAG: peptidylprolyl isomerase [Hyphomonadaceae bacterium]
MKRFLAAGALALLLAAPATAQEVTPLAPLPATPAGPVVTLHTTMGDIQVTLEPDGAPKTAAQFLGLVKSGHYNGAAVYRVEPGFVIQLGDLDAKLDYRAPRRPPIPLETEHNKHSRGALSFAHAEEPDSGQSTIFISLGENSGLDATPGASPNTTGYAVFGHVTAGMDVVDAIGALELQPDGGPFPGRLPKQSVVVTKAEITSGN